MTISNKANLIRIWNGFTEPQLKVAPLVRSSRVVAKALILPFSNYPSSSFVQGFGVATRVQPFFYHSPRHDHTSLQAAALFG